MTLTAGFIAAAIAALGFGSNFVPVKQYDMGDGMLFQLIMPLGIWLFGLMYVITDNIITGKALYFHPLALLGGIIWNTGNVLTVTIIKCIGMALGLAIWSATSMIVGWLTGKFGLLGTPKDDTVKTEWINYFGISLILISLIIFFNVTPNPNKDENDSYKIVNVLVQELDEKYYSQDQPEGKNPKSWVDNLAPKQRIFLGVVLSLFAGVCYGTCFCPIQYVMKHHKDNDNYSQQLQDYAFTHYCGILLTAMIYFTIYTLFMRNKPQVNNQALLPAIASGFVWAIAQTCFFIATNKNNLGTDTAFPIVSGSPQVVGALWGVLVFREVSRRRDVAILICAVFVCICGVASIGLSKIKI